MRPRAVVLLNRGSHGAGDAVADRVAELLRGGPPDAVIESVPAADLAAAATRAAQALRLADARPGQAGHTTLVAAGGDGTVSTVASVAAAHGLVLGILPLGTMNHFARDAGIPLDLEAAAAVIRGGRVADVDVGDVNGRLFLNNSSLGLYPRLVWERERQQQQGRRKWPAFALAAFRVWRQYRRITVTIEGRGYRLNVRTPFVFVGNNEYAVDGGRIDSRASLTGGRLQLCLAPDAERRHMTAIVVAAMAGRLAAVESFDTVSATELTIATPSRRAGVSLDGEVVVLSTPLRYTIRPRALRVLVPAQEGAP
jgi:diacylglycerol kinase family enzyme